MGAYVAICVTARNLIAIRKGRAIPDAGLYIVRPGDLPPRKVRVLTDILLEYFGAGQSRAAV